MCANLRRSTEHSFQPDVSGAIDTLRPVPTSSPQLLERLTLPKILSKDRATSNTSRLTWRDGLVLVVILGSSALFKIVFMPAPPLAPYTLITNPHIIESVKKILTTDWRQLLLPYEYEPGRYYWSTTAIFLIYIAQELLNPLQYYVVFSSIFLTVTFILIRIIDSSLIFAATFAFMFAFGTQLNYSLTYGNLIAIYLVLTYIAINFSIAVVLISCRRTGLVWHAAFAVSLVVVALANEIWLDYAVAMMIAAAFGMIWSRRHNRIRNLVTCAFLLCTTLCVLSAYLIVRMRFVHQYLAPGAEEELLVTYHSGILMIDDLVANFFTLLYLTLSNYFPSFITSSNSLTYLNNFFIIAEQNGYDTGHQQLVLMNHLFLWRFYAGAAAVTFIAGTIWALVRAWQQPSSRRALVAALALMVITGFSTHLMIKMRPYNVVPALPYKALISITAFTVLVAYLTSQGSQLCTKPSTRRTLIASVWCFVFLAALTRPHMQSRLLSEVGLVGLGDPLGQIIQWLQ